MGRFQAVWTTIRNLVVGIFNIIISILLTVTVGPIIVLLYVLNELIRRLIITPLLKIFHGNKYRLVPEGADNVWSFRKFGNSRNILVLAVYKDRIDPEEYEKNFMERVINFVDQNGRRPFLKLQTIYTKKFGYCCWKKAEDFNIKNHIRVLDPNSFPEKEQKFLADSDNSGTLIPVLTESDVLNYLGTLAEDIGEDRPQWEEVIVQNFLYDHEIQTEIQVLGRRKILTLKPNEGCKIRSARIFRCHHAYMDGASFLLITSKCMADGEFPHSMNPLAPLKFRKWFIFKLYFSSIFFGVRTLLKTIIVAARANNRFVTKKFHGQFSHVWSKPIQLSILREIKSITGSSLPAILTTATAAALRKFEEKFPEEKIRVEEKAAECFRRGADQDLEAGNSTGLPPKDRTLIGMIGAVGPYPDVAPRNRYTVVNFRANTASCTRIQRLEATTRKMNRMGKAADFLVNLWMFQIFGKFPAFLVQNMLKNGGSPIVLSNTPWAKDRVSLMGDEVEDIGGWVPLLAFSGVGFLIIGYCETLRFCGVAEKACISKEHLKFLIQETENEIRLLSEEVLSANKSMDIQVDV